MPRVDANAELVRKTPAHKGLDQLLKKLTDGAIKVGVLTGTGVYPGEKALISEIAWWNEFGTENIPERAFMRTTVLTQSREWIDVTRNLLDKRINGQISEDRALGLLGELVKADIQKSITDWEIPANAPSTQAQKKGVNNPLVDKGHLRQSIQWLIIKPGEQ